MINIKKQKEPQSLKEYRDSILRQGSQIQKKHYENIPQNVKADIQISLLEEQNYLCCYCMKNINKHTIVIEHFKPKAKGKYEDLALDYNNLLGSCEGCSGKNNHCDKNKKDIELNILPNPSLPNTIRYRQFIDYSISGEVKLKDVFLASLNEAEKTSYLNDINLILNLNDYELKKARIDKWHKAINIIQNSKNNSVSNFIKPNAAFNGFLEAMFTRKFGKT